MPGLQPEPGPQGNQRRTVESPSTRPDCSDPNILASMLGPSRTEQPEVRALAIDPEQNRCSRLNPDEEIPGGCIAWFDLKGNENSLLRKLLIKHIGLTEDEAQTFDLPQRRPIEPNPKCLVLRDTSLITEEGGKAWPDSTRLWIILGKQAVITVHDKQSEIVDCLWKAYERQDREDAPMGSTGVVAGALLDESLRLRERQCDQLNELINNLSQRLQRKQPLPPQAIQTWIPAMSFLVDKSGRYVRRYARMLDAIQHQTQVQAGPSADQLHTVLDLARTQAEEVLGQLATRERRLTELKENNEAVLDYRNSRRIDAITQIGLPLAVLAGVQGLLESFGVSGSVVEGLAVTAATGLTLAGLYALAKWRRLI